MLDRAVVKSRELRAGQLDQLDPLGRRERPRLDRVVDLEGDACPLLGIELGMHDRAVGVAVAVADLVGVEIEPDHGLDGISARLRARRAVPESRPTGNRFATAHPASSSSTFTAKKGCGRNQSGPDRGSTPELSGSRNT